MKQGQLLPIKPATVRDVVIERLAGFKYRQVARDRKRQIRRDQKKQPILRDRAVQAHLFGEDNTTCD